MQQVASNWLQEDPINKENKKYPNTIPPLI